MERKELNVSYQQGKIQARTATRLLFRLPESTPAPPLFSPAQEENSGAIWGRCPTLHLCPGCPRGLKGKCSFCRARQAVGPSGGASCPSDNLANTLWSAEKEDRGN